MILKPENGGPAVAMFVTSIADDVSRTRKKEAQFKFIGRTADGEASTAWMSVESAERQFTRIGVTRETASNRWLEFSRTADGYWDINLPAGSPPAVAASPSAAPAMSAPAAAPAPAKADRQQELAKLITCYGKCFDAAMKMAIEKLDAGEVGSEMSNITHEGIATMAHSLFGAVLSRGLCA